MTETKQNILIVDDQRANLLALEAILEDLDMNIIKATSGNEALKLILQHNISLVLLDVQMPGINGFEVAELMKQKKSTQDIPIIFITAISKEEKYIFKGYENGAVDYIYKPIKNEILKSKVKVFLKLNKQRRLIENKTIVLEDKIKELEQTKKELNEANEKLERLANIDGLTQISNRRSFDQRLKKEYLRLSRTKQPLSLLLIDIDYFKRYNDRYGHQAGDDCLKKVATKISEATKRPADFTARYGGEEFSVILPETNNQGAITVAEEIRKGVQSLQILNEDPKVCDFITVSIGVETLYPETNVHYETIIGLADKALYKAKEKGRNRVLSLSTV